MGTRSLRIVLVALTATVVVAVVAFVSSRSLINTIAGEAQPAVASQDEQDIRDVVAQFAVATKNVDRDAVAALMCPDDAEAYLDNTYDPGDGVERADPVTEVEIRWIAVRIEGDHASATLETPYSRGEATLYLSRIDGAWLLCEDAEDAMAAADGPAATPTD